MRQKNFVKVKGGKSISHQNQISNQLMRESLVTYFHKFAIDFLPIFLFLRRNHFIILFSPIALEFKKNVVKCIYTLQIVKFIFKNL